VPAGPAGQQRGLPRPRVGDRGRARKQPPGRLVYPSREAPAGSAVEVMPRCYKSGKPTGGERPGRQRVYAQVQPFDGTWKVTTLVVEKW